MDAAQFRAAAAEMASYITDYHATIRHRRALAEVSPGYLRPLVPTAAPETPDEWSDVMADVERVIMPGVTHWQSPHFHAYFPTACSYPSILADMLSGAIACIGFSWVASPACTELEEVMLDWLAKLLGLPTKFLSGAAGPGGGVIQGTASEATLVGLLAAKTKMIRSLKEAQKDAYDPTTVTKLVAYCSDQAHSSVERAGMLAGVEVRQLQSNDNYSLRGAALRSAVLADRAAGLVPFYVVGTLGTTSCCAYDNVHELGEVARELGLWLHVDAAYAGSALVCEELRPLMAGLDLAHSFNFNPHKWLLVNFDCSAMWLEDARDVVDAFNVDPLYLKHDHQGQVPDYRHWQIPLGRRFRSLKLWFVLRLYGRQGLQQYVRKHVALAQQFEQCVKGDARFEVVHKVTLGLVCFRLKGRDNAINEQLLKHLNAAGRIHLVPGQTRDCYFLRFCVCGPDTEAADVQVAWREVVRQADLLLRQ